MGSIKDPSDLGELIELNQAFPTEPSDTRK